ncbi:hypothetical protein JXA70_01360 [candidate division KSB1 bacterium]|nr:hypothetical protein [candidate division KSB1 bacterium]
MTGNLDETLKTLITESLPGLFGGANPAVKLTMTSELLEFAPESADALASEPRPDDAVDTFSFDPDNPGGPYTLSKPPYPGPRRVRLTTDIGDRLPLREEEVLWDAENTQQFTLELRESRDLTDITGLEVLYGVTAVFTKIKATQIFSVLLQLQSNKPAENLEQAEALVLSVIELNRGKFMENGGAHYEDDAYGADIEIKSLKFVKGTSPETKQRLLTYIAELELKASRALREDEGAPIERIRTTGRPVDPDRPVNIHIDVDA